MLFSRKNVSPATVSFLDVLPNMPSKAAPVSRASKPLISSLTGLRFYAAFLVFLSHTYHFNFFGATGPIVVILNALGHLGVSLFYILSGFVLFINYAPAQDRRISLKQFYIARIARIYPVFLLTTLLAVPLEVFSPSKTAFWFPLVMNVSLMHCMVGTTCGTFNDVGWSIGVEFFFYLLFPLLTSLFFCFRKLTAVIVGLCLYLLVIAFFASGQNFYTGAHFPINRTLEFLAGLCGGWFYVNANFNFNQELLKLWHKAFLHLLLLALALILMSMPLLVQQLGWLGNVYYVFYIIPGLSLILLLAWMEKNSMPCLLLSTPLAVWGGEISYSFYLIHNLVFRYLHYGSLILFDLNMKTAKLPLQILLAVVVLLITCVASVILYQYVELPYREKIKNVFKKA